MLAHGALMKLGAPCVLQRARSPLMWPLGCDIAAYALPSSVHNLQRRRIFGALMLQLV